VVGVTASGVTPFVRAALRAARARGCATVLVACTPSRSLRGLADVVIAPAPGPEVLAGSTRLKAGTATKLVLNTLTTAAMVRLGKVYGNRMIDLQPRSLKLRDRAVRLVAEIAGVPRRRAEQAFTAAGNRVKLAVVMARASAARGEAARLLAESGGDLRAALGRVPPAAGAARGKRRVS
jgi:N-acetylmuramic acid 6-phosphate etherase